MSSDLNVGEGRLSWLPSAPVLESSFNLRVVVRTSSFNLHVAEEAWWLRLPHGLVSWSWARGVSCVLRLHV